MDVQKYCEDMGVELSTWEKELNDVLNVVETFPPEERKRVSPKVKSLRSLIEDITIKIERLKNQCPLDWNAMANELQRSMSELRRSMDDIWDRDHVAGGYVGG